MKVGIAGVGMVAPGIENWTVARRWLCSDAAYDLHGEFPALKPLALSANERRRASSTIKIALHCAQQAMAGVSEMASAAELTSVFASANGDLQVVDKILAALTMPGKPVSPTQFHNSVHNAAAGYWSIASGSLAASSSIAAAEASFSVGLLEAVAQVLAGDHAVLLVVYDSLPPVLLKAQVAVTVPFGMALLLVPSGSSARNMQIVFDSDAGKPDKMVHPQFEQLRMANPAARSLPLLQALALGRLGCLRLPYLHKRTVQLVVDVYDS